MIAEQVKTGEIQKDLWVPLEDIHDGWEKSGSVGQEVYGAGLAFGIIPRQYVKLPHLQVLIFVDYPIANFRAGKDSATFQLLGSPQLKAQLRFIGLPKSMRSKITVEQKSKSTYQRVEASKTNHYALKGAGSVRITWVL